jgi:branched-subunit amino acid ABC-type transport system permease component
VAYFLQQTINGLTLGCIYGLIALGYTMVYGIVGMINFAHGEIYMIGAYISLIMFTLLGLLGITWVPLALLASRHESSASVRHFRTYGDQAASMDVSRRSGLRSRLSVGVQM